MQQYLQTCYDFAVLLVSPIATTVIIQLAWFMKLSHSVHMLSDQPIQHTGSLRAD